MVTHKQLVLHICPTWLWYFCKKMWPRRCGDIVLIQTFLMRQRLVGIRGSRAGRALVQGNSFNRTRNIRLNFILIRILPKRRYIFWTNTSELESLLNQDTISGHYPTTLPMQDKCWVSSRTAMSGWPDPWSAMSTSSSLQITMVSKSGSNSLS